MLDFFNHLFEAVTEIERSIVNPLSEVNIRTFENNGTYSKPNNLLHALVFITGGGGGAGSSVGALSSPGRFISYSAGGGGGATAVKLFQTSDLGSSITVTVGSGGSGSSTEGSAASDGGTSSFGNLLTATGGKRGSNNQYSETSDSFYKGGTATGGDLNFRGISAKDGNYYLPGGPSLFSPGGSFGVYWNGDLTIRDGGDAPGYGGGGGGTSNGEVTSNVVPLATGGDGADGVCVIVEFLR